MKCRSVKKQLPLYAGDDLPQEKATVIKAHVAACDACQVELDALKAARNSARSLRDEAVPNEDFERLRQTVMEKVAAEEWRVPVLRRRQGAVLAALAPLGIAAVAALVLQGPAPMPGQADDGSPPRAVITPPEDVESSDATEMRVDEPVVVKIYTDDPDIVVYWLGEA